MVLTKESIIAQREIATERYILSTLPVLYINFKKDWQGSGKFVTQDGAGHVATVTGVLWTPQGGIFDGIDDKIVLGTTIPALFAGAFTIIVWLRFTTLGTLLILTRTTTGVWETAGDRQLYLDAGVFHFDTFGLGGTPPTSIAGPSAGAFCQVVLTNVSDVQTFYVNGVAAGTFIQAMSGAADSANSAIRLGQYGNDLLVMNGIEGEVQLYNRALSAVDVQRNYIATKWRYQ